MNPAALARFAELRLFPTVIFVGWAVWSFTGLRTLTETVTGYPPWMAALVPLILDCVAAMSWLRYERTRSREALAAAVGVTGIVMTGNGVAAAVAAGALEPTLGLVVALGAVPSGLALATLHLLAKRDRETSVWTETPAPSGSAPATGAPSPSASSAATTTSPKPASPTAPAASPSPTPPHPPTVTPAVARHAETIRERGLVDVPLSRLVVELGASKTTVKRARDLAANGVGRVNGHGTS